MENSKQKRIYAFIIDSIIANSIGIMLLSPFDLEKDIPIGKFTLIGQDIVYGYSFKFMMILLYFIAFDILNKGKTFGKSIVSIVVVDSVSLAELSLVNRIKRTLLKAVALLIWPISLLLFFSFDYSIQDKVMKTKTIRTK